MLKYLFSFEPGTIHSDHLFLNFSSLLHFISLRRKHTTRTDASLPRRLEGLSQIHVRDKLNKVRAAVTLSSRMNSEHCSSAYLAPPPSLSEYDLSTARSYGPEYVLVCFARKLDTIQMIDMQDHSDTAPPSAG